MHSLRQFCTTLGLAALAATAGATGAEAQTPAATPTAAGGAPSLMATRADLEATLRGRTTAEQAEQIRQRLRSGDLQPGDRVVLYVEGEEALTDTFVVRPTRALTLPTIPQDVSVQGVLRSELDAHLTKEIGKYVRNPRVEAIPLIRLTVTGQVGRPGFYDVPAETLASDVVMVAGGPTGNANLRKTVVRRSGVEIATKNDVANALDRGVSLDQMNLQGGDEIRVGKDSGGLLGIMPYVGAITGLAWAVTRVVD